MHNLGIAIMPNAMPDPLKSQPQHSNGPAPADQARPYVCRRGGRPCPAADVGNFNGVRTGKIMITMDESYWAGSSKDKGQLRNLISEDTHDVRVMHTDL